MMEIISILSDICGILAFLISIFAVSQIFKLKQKTQGNNNNQINVKGNIGRDFVGRDKN